MKKDRQKLILNIIRDHDVRSQEELLGYLTDAGYNVTQATISRDMRELHITKVSYDNNKHKYAALRMGDESASFKHVLGNCIISMDYSENIIVVKTVAGMAMAVGASIDALNIDEIMGTIAGDDTIFLAIKEKNMAASIIGRIQKCC